MEKYNSSEEVETELKSMPCGYSDKSSEELQSSESREEGWVMEWNFHANDRGQWNDACKKADDLQKDGWWEVVWALPSDESVRKDGVTYVFKRKTEKYKQYEEDLKAGKFNQSK